VIPALDIAEFRVFGVTFHTFGLLVAVGVLLGHHMTVRRARALGLARGGARAVGQALRRNPLPILVPCHRVVSAAGLGGYAGTTEGALAKVKRTLLELEREV
jgi:O-6-methylguanine DNA methyltransferase